MKKSKVFNVVQSFGATQPIPRLLESAADMAFRSLDYDTIPRASTTTRRVRVTVIVEAVK